MCAIGGIINVHGRQVLIDDLSSMIKLMKHRGPDGEGYFIDGNVGLAHARLAIIDASDNGSQPMKNRDASLVITYNGELYNYIELRDELVKRGHVFLTKTDTEVLLAAYQEWGRECLPRFNGMWAFAIWDTRKRTLFCARDRFGEKPFYYFYDGSTLIFSSEIKALLMKMSKVRANESLIYDYLLHGMLDHTEETFFQSVKKLPPASWMEIGENMQLGKYWDFEVSNENGYDYNSSIKDEIRELFVDSVRIRLRSDVPVGSCLSGGIDSSSIVSVIDRFFPGSHQFQTFSACFDDPSLDERTYIEAVKKNTSILPHYTFPQPEQFDADLEKLLWHQEEPFGSTSIFAQWCVAQESSRYVKVLLDGQGADEGLCGYRKFYFFYLKKLLEKRFFSRFIWEGISFFSSYEILKTLHLKHGMKYLKKDLSTSTARLLRDSFAKLYSHRSLAYGYTSDLGSRIKNDYTTWSLPVLLRYEDKNMMAHSVESRLPFLDHRFVEKIASLPLSYKMKNGFTKYILRDALEGILPLEIAKRRSKLGFAAPQEPWLYKYREKIAATIGHNEFLQYYVNSDQIIEMLNGSRSLNHVSIFRTYLLAKWAKMFL